MKKSRLFVTSIATMAAFLLGSCAKEVGITYTLLWDTKIEKVGNNLVIEKDENGITTISKKVDGKVQDNLKVLVFTDFHLDHKQDCCNYTYTMIAKNIMNVKPDLVLLCGDNITSIQQKPRARQFAQLMEDLDVYWSFVLGNHEGEDYPEKDMMSRPEQVEFFSQYKHCLIDPSIKHTSDGAEVWGDGNHAINILNSNNEIAQTFFFLDSGIAISQEDFDVNYKAEVDEFIRIGKAKETVKPIDLADYIKDSQIKWYKEVMAKNTKANATVFSHVPLKDMEDAYLEYYKKYNQQQASKWLEEQDITHPWPYTEVTGEVDGCDIKMLTGRRAEGMCYSPHDVRYSPFNSNEIKHTPMFDAMIKSGGTHPAFFCGHDHQNNFVYEQTVGNNNDTKIITLGYIQPACYSSNNFWTKGMLGEYPLSDTKKYHLIQGYSVIDFNLKNDDTPFEFKHYTNFDVWKGEHYEEACEYIRLTRNPQEYKPAIGEYPTDPNNPFPPALLA